MSRDLDDYKDDDGDFEFLYLSEANALAIITYVQGLSDDQLDDLNSSYFNTFGVLLGDPNKKAR